MSQYEETSLWLQAAGIVVTALGLLFAFLQLRKMAKAAEVSQNANAISSTAALIQVEMMLFESLHKIDSSAAAQLRLFGQMESEDRDAVTEKHVEASEREQAGAIQNFLNSLDRLCACVRRGVIPHAQAKIEYGHVIDAAIDDYQQMFTDFDKVFPNILALRREWVEGKDSKSL